MIACSTLLKSCATPPASWPTAFIFCDCASCSSICAQIGGVERVENGRLALAAFVAHRGHPDPHRAARRRRRACSSSGGMSLAAFGRRAQGRRHLRVPSPSGTRSTIERTLAASPGARQRAEQARERRVRLHDPAVPVDGRDGDRRVVEEPGEAHFGGALALVDIEARRAVEHQRPRRARAPVLAEGDAVIEPHRQELAVAAAQVEIEGFRAHVAGLARERRHHARRTLRGTTSAETQAAGADLGEIVIEPGRQGGVQIDDRRRRGSIDRKPAGA